MIRYIPAGKPMAEYSIFTSPVRATISGETVLAGDVLFIHNSIEVGSRFVRHETYYIKPSYTGDRSGKWFDGFATPEKDSMEGGTGGLGSLLT